MTQITVQGSSSTTHAAERATVRVAIDHEGPKRETVFADTTAVTAQVTSSIRLLRDAEPSPVESWSSDRLSVWASRTRSNGGRLQAQVYHAAIGVTAVFRDFDAMARWVEEVALLEGANVGGITWDLQDETRERLTEQVRTKAVQDAAAKALVYARAAGLGSVTATAIADPGMLGRSSGSGNEVMMAGGMRMAKGVDSLEFTPADLEVAARVDAQFSAS